MFHDKYLLAGEETSESGSCLQNMKKVIYLHC